jgi:hypothetical protein
LLSFGEALTDEREASILAEVRAGRIRPIRWVPLDCSRGEQQCTVWVADRPLALGSADDFVYVNVRHTTAERIALELEAFLPTTRISDLAWQQASVRLRPHTQKADAHMADTSRMIAHHDAVERERDGREGLVRTAGKDWVTTNRLVGRPSRSANFGWHHESGRFRSPGGAPVLQPLATAHGIFHTDYSQTVCLVRADVLVDGERGWLADVLQSEKLASLVSDEGRLQIVRHPAVVENIA